MKLAVLGTDTGVGKTQVCIRLALGLRAIGRRVWLHKPIACGGWDGATCEDARALAPYLGDGQPLATLCPRQFPEPCSPHLAAHAAGVLVKLDELVDTAREVATAANDADVILESAGGLLVPLGVDRKTNADLVHAVNWPALLVTRPNLGTLNHTQLTVNEARRRGIRLLGLVVNYSQKTESSLAISSAASELRSLTGLPVLAEIPFGPVSPGATADRDLAQAVLAAAD